MYICIYKNATQVEIREKEGQLPRAFHDKAQSYLLLLCNSHFSGVGNQLATHNCLLVGGDCLHAVELYV